MWRASRTLAWLAHGNVNHDGGEHVVYCAMKRLTVALWATTRATTCLFADLAMLSPSSFGKIRIGRPLSNALHTNQFEVSRSVESLSCFLSWLLGVQLAAWRFDNGHETPFMGRDIRLWISLSILSSPLLHAAPMTGGCSSCWSSRRH